MNASKPSWKNSPLKANQIFSLLIIRNGIDISLENIFKKWNIKTWWGGEGRGFQDCVLGLATEWYNVLKYLIITETQSHQSNRVLMLKFDFNLTMFSVLSWGCDLLENDFLPLFLF